jgi:hypothetical protein
VTAKRAIWLFRAVFYPAAALVVLMWLLHRGEPPAGPLTLSGHTSQGMFVTVGVRDGRVYRFRAWIRSRCDGGGEYRTRWVSGPRFSHRGDGAQQRASYPAITDWSTWQELAFDAHAAGAMVSGTLRATVRVSEPFRGVCHSGPVTFSAE